MTTDRRPVAAWSVGGVAALGAAHYAVDSLHGILVLVLVTAECCGLLLLGGALWNRLVRRNPLPRRSLLRGVLVLAASGATLVLFELALASVQALAPTETAPVIPPHLDLRPAGQGDDFYWLNIPHLHNTAGFRERPLTGRRPGTFRVIALGDSLTYGKGIPVEARYANQLETVLGETYQVEVLAIAKRGFQSEDILHVARDFVPTLAPNLVLYGHCLNDFLPSAQGQYTNNMRWQVPLPAREKRALADETLVGKVLADRFNQVLMRAGIRRDFYDDILEDFRNYRTRFAADMVALNGFVTGQGLPPVVGLVLNQFPDEPRGREVGRIAEEAMRAAGMTVIPATYVDEYEGRDEPLHLGKWDGHPNALANRLFAEAFMTYFTGDRGRALLAPYAKARSETLRPLAHASPVSDGDEAAVGPGPLPAVEETATVAKRESS